MRRRSIVLLLLGGLAGLLVRYRMLFYMGVVDMDSYYEWGKAVLEKGLLRGFRGVYFPIQYQLFEFCAWVVARTGTAFFTVFKSGNLIFDLGSFLLLVLLLRRERANPAFALLYWLHPWFLAVSGLGYVDFQFTFFVLLCLWLLGRDRMQDYFLAGVPLGVAFLMKPQAQILVVAAFFHASVSYLRKRDLRPFGILAGPVVFFLSYEAYFIHALPRHRALAALGLPKAYLGVTNVMPALTAQMTNFWAPIAYFIRGPEEPISVVSDQIQLLPYLSARSLAAVFVLTLVGVQTWRTQGMDNLSPSRKLVTIFGFASMAVPFFMTSAHENHLFLGSVLLVLLAARSRSLLVQIAVQVLLLTQFLNIFSLYGEHPQALASLLRPTQSDGILVIYSLISLACFAVILRLYWLPPGRSELGSI